MLRGEGREGGGRGEEADRDCGQVFNVTESQCTESAEKLKVKR